MEELTIGMDLCDAYTQITCTKEGKIWSFPTLIGKRKGEDQWLIGKDAYSLKLSNEGVIIDKLVSLARENKPIPIEDTIIQGRELLQRFFKLVITEISIDKDAEHTSSKACRIRQMVITLPSVDRKIMDCLLCTADYLEIFREQIHVISHGESFVYHVLSQKKDVWAGQVGLFEFSQNGLHYYEMKLQKGKHQTTVFSEHEELDKTITLDTLEMDSGIEQVDKALCSHGERLLAKKLFSSVVLTGIGFDKTDWAEEFMKLLCKRRKVFSEHGLFAMGAFCRAEDFEKEETDFPYTLICEGRLNVSVSIEVTDKGKLTPITLASCGDNWHEAKGTMELILDDEQELAFQIQSLDGKKKNEVKVSLEKLPNRPNRTTRIAVKVGFLDEHTMIVMIKDKGFGELFPATNTTIRKEIAL